MATLACGPPQYQCYVDTTGTMQAAPGAKSKKPPDYSHLKKREAIRRKAKDDSSLPRGLRELIEDDELWALYQPTGDEIQTLRSTFGAIGEGTKGVHRDALRLVRELRAM